MPATIAITENFADLLDSRFRKIFNDKFKESQDQANIDTLFGKMTSGKNYEKVGGVGALGDVPTFDGTLSYDNISQLYDTTVTFPERALGMKVQRQLYDDDEYSVMDKRPKQLATTVTRTRGKLAASVFLNAFTSADGSDGVALCSASHPYSPDDATVQTNTGTSTMSAANIEAVRRIGMTDILNDKGQILDINYDTIICSPSKEETAWEIINSRGKVNTANNNRNFHEGRYKLLVWPRLNTYPWFMIDSQLCKEHLEWWDRIKPEFNQDRDFETYVAKWSTYFRCNTSYSDWRFIVGQNATS